MIKTFTKESHPPKNADLFVLTILIMVNWEKSHSCTNFSIKITFSTEYFLFNCNFLLTALFSGHGYR